jgi:hypothetical protein
MSAALRPVVIGLGWAAALTALLVLPPVLWNGGGGLAGQLTDTFVAALITALYAPELTRAAQT